MKKNSLGIFEITLLVVVGLIAGYLIQPLIPTQQSSKQNPTSIRSHFYELGLNPIEVGDSTPWVTATVDGTIFALSGDRAEESKNPTVTSSSDLSHRVWYGSSAATELNLIAELDLGALETPMFGIEQDLVHRTLDFKVQPGEVGKETPYNLLVSYVVSDAVGKCRHLAVQAFELARPLEKEIQQLKGTLVFRSPCFPFSDSGDDRLQQSGGRLEFLPSASSIEQGDWALLLTVGDFGLLEANSTMIDEEAKSMLGSVLQLSELGWVRFARGLRNAQGIARVEIPNLEGDFLLTDHGPRGGDELNELKADVDFGWPEVSYGTTYDPEANESKPLVEGTHSGFERPLFSWLPSVAPSQLVQVAGPEFGRWWSSEFQGSATGDVLVSSLLAESIFRLRFNGGRVEYVEQVFIGERIRTLSQLPSGELLIGADSGSVYRMSAVKVWDSIRSEFLPR